MVLYNLLPSEGARGYKKKRKTFSSERGAVLVGTFRAPLALTLHGAPPSVPRGS